MQRLFIHSSGSVNITFYFLFLEVWKYNEALQRNPKHITIQRRTLTPTRENNVSRIFGKQIIRVPILLCRCVVSVCCVVCFCLWFDCHCPIMPVDPVDSVLPPGTLWRSLLHQSGHLWFSHCFLTRLWALWHAHAVFAVVNHQRQIRRYI